MLRILWNILLLYLLDCVRKADESFLLFQFAERRSVLTLNDLISFLISLQARIILKEQ